MNDMTPPAVQTITVAAPTTEPATVAAIAAQAEVFDVVDDDTAQIAAEELKSIAGMLAGIEAERVKITKPLFEAKKATDALFKKLTDPLERANHAYKQKIIGYQQEQDRKRREEQARAEEAARKATERLEAEAKKLEKKGKVEEAAAKRDVAASMPTTFVAPPPAKIEGVSTRANWKARITSKSDVIKFVAANPAFEYLLDVNESKANGLAKQQESADLGVPGLQGYDDRVASVRR